VERLHDGDLTTETIEAELSRCSGVILWVNEWVFGSSYVQKVELPAIARAVRRRGVRLVPVIDGLDPGEASRRLSEIGFGLGDGRLGGSGSASSDAGEGGTRSMPPR
jgi:hypothetical protein